MSTEFSHEPDAHRYTMRVDGDVVSVLEYQDHGAGTVMHHTVTIPKYRGKGYAAELVEYAVNDVQSRGRGPITPTLLVRRRVVRPASGAFRAARARYRPRWPTRADRGHRRARAERRRATAGPPDDLRELLEVERDRPVDDDPVGRHAHRLAEHHFEAEVA